MFHHQVVANHQESSGKQALPPLGGHCSTERRYSQYWPKPLPWAIPHSFILLGAGKSRNQTYTVIIHNYHNLSIGWRKFFRTGWRNLVGRIGNPAHDSQTDCQSVLRGRLACQMVINEQHFLHRIVRMRAVRWKAIFPAMCAIWLQDVCSKQLRRFRLFWMPACGESACPCQKTGSFSPKEGGNVGCRLPRSPFAISAPEYNMR